MMTDAEFAAAQRQIAIAGGLIAQVDLVGYIERIAAAELAKAETLPPAVWEKAAPRLKELRELATSLIQFQVLVIDSMKRQLDEERKPHIIVPGINDA